MDSPLNDLWDKFDLAPNCGAPSADLDFDLDAIMDETYSNLESFAEAFGIKEEAILMEDSEMITPKIEPDDLFEEVNAITEYDFLNDFNLQPLETNDIETIKSDCMWSSTLTHITESPHGHHNRGRRRDISLTLSECAEGTVVLKDIELLGNNPSALESSNFMTGLNYLETPLATSESDTESASTDEDIDVVTSDDTVNPYTLTSHKKVRIEPGRSLLLSRNRQPQDIPAQQTFAQQQTFIDHSYFSVMPPSPVSSANIQGLLTPTESSDDDECFSTSLFNSGAASGIDKRKIAHAVQSLMKKNLVESSSGYDKKPSMPDNIKFKFRMKFRSNTPRQPSSHSSSSSSSTSSSSVLAISHRHNNIDRRKTLLKNSAPKVQESKHQYHHSSRSSAPSGTSLLANNRSSPSKTGQSKSSRQSTSSRSSSNGGQDQKCREIRDLHNSMERQRRVDLRKNFDRLKAVVPDLADMEKASKLNILNKASEYCLQLASADTKMKKEVEKEAAKNALLRKKLQSFQNLYNSGAKMGSSRISLAQSRSKY